MSDKYERLAEAKLSRELMEAKQEIERLRAERDVAVAMNQRTYCAYCGHEEAVDGDGSLIAEHIRMCGKHPMRTVELQLLEAKQEIEQLRCELSGKAGELERLRGQWLSDTDLEKIAERMAMVLVNTPVLQVMGGTVDDFEVWCKNSKVNGGENE